MLTTWIMLGLATIGTTAETGPAAPAPAAMSAAADYSANNRGQAMVVMYDGQVVFERYANGGSADQVQMLASGSKSFVGIAAAAAIDDGLIALDDRASDAITEWKDDPAKAKITYRQLLTLTSGLTPGERGAAIRAPAWQEIAAKRMVSQPGERFDYGAYQLIAAAYAIERKLGNETFEAYLKRRVLDAIGVQVVWRFRCHDGRPQVGGGAFMTARDWATFGEFVRLQGRWGDQQVINAETLAACFQGTQQNPAYGLTWWLKKPVDDALRRKIPLLAFEWSDVLKADWLPNDLVAACGAGKQRLYVIPSRRLVIVRQGSIGRGFSDAEFLRRLLATDAAAD